MPSTTRLPSLLDRAAPGEPGDGRPVPTAAPATVSRHRAPVGIAVDLAVGARRRAPAALDGRTRTVRHDLARAGRGGCDEDRRGRRTRRRVAVGRSDAAAAEPATALGRGPPARLARRRHHPRSAPARGGAATVAAAGERRRGGGRASADTGTGSRGRVGRTHVRRRDLRAPRRDVPGARRRRLERRGARAARRDPVRDVAVASPGAHPTRRGLGRSLDGARRRRQDRGLVLPVHDARQLVQGRRRRLRLRQLGPRSSPQFWMGNGPEPYLPDLRKTNFIRWFTGVVYYVFGSNVVAGFFVFGLLALDRLLLLVPGDRGLRAVPRQAAVPRPRAVRAEPRVLAVVDRQGIPDAARPRRRWRSRWPCS